MFHKKLVKILHYKHLTMQHIVNDTKINEEDLSRFLSGEKLPDYMHIQKISKALGVEARYFFSNEDHYFELLQCRYLLIVFHFQKEF